MTVSDGEISTATAASDTFGAAHEKVLYGASIGGIDFTVSKATGVEGVSQPFRFELSLFFDGGDLFDPDSRVGTRGSVSILRGGDRLRTLVGLVTEVSLNATASGQPEVWLVLEPQLALLKHKRDTRLYCDKSVPEIVSDVLSNGHVVHTLRLRDSYAARPYTVQYGETDFAFVSRLLEDEGIYYFFLDDEEGTMVLADDARAYEAIDIAHPATASGGADAGSPLIPFKPAASLTPGTEAVHELGRRARLAPNAVTLRDFNPDHPQLDMDVGQAGPCAAGVEWYDYPGKFALPAEGTRRARLMSEAFACAAAAFSGASTGTRFRPGGTFKLIDAPGSLDGSYVVTRLAHDFSRESGTFHNTFEALRADVAFRPARTTKVPQITGGLTAFVMGPAGADIHCDDFGRVKVRFPWDRRSKFDDSASLWIPVMQDNTGSSAGIPRVGWEVLVNFVEGDPDRPVVMGRTYNGADPFPETLPDNKTVSSLTSLTSPTRNGANMIRFEDKAGSEQIFMQSEKDQTVNVANDKQENVGNTEFNTTTGDENVTIGNNQTVHVGVDRSLNVSGDQSTKVAASRKRDVGANEKSDILGNRSITIGGSHTRRIDGYDSVRVKSLTEKIGVIDLEASIKANDTSAGMMHALTVGGAMVELTAKEKQETCKAFRIETVGGLVYTKAGIDVTMTSDSRTTTVGAALSVDATGALSLLGGTQLDGTTMQALFDGTDCVTLRAGGSALTLKGDLIAINTDKNIQLESRGPSHLGASVAVLKKGG